MTGPDLRNLLICRQLLRDKTMKALIAAMIKKDDANTSLASSRLIYEAERIGFSGSLIRGYLLHRLAHDENIAARTIEAENGNIGESLLAAFTHDIKLLLPLLEQKSSVFIPCEFLDNYKPTSIKTHESRAAMADMLKDAHTASEYTNAFMQYYKKYGYGDIASYSAFCWDENNRKLRGIKHFEPQDLSDIIGYERQKKQLLENTHAFINNLPSNNVLLVGARGTGKSSSVKALAKHFYSDGLRLLQITRHQLTFLPDIMEYLRQFASKHFIIFMDDLSFEESETEYKYLKSAIEGGVESRPKNVLIYATSNRRHLIKETWRDRDSDLDELYRKDSMNETISLSDRFGLIITFMAPDQQQYLDIISHYLQKSGIKLDDDKLRILGRQWEVEHSGRSGRTAQQFVNYYLGTMK